MVLFYSLIWGYSLRGYSEQSNQSKDWSFGKHLLILHFFSSSTPERLPLECPHLTWATPSWAAGSWACPTPWPTRGSSFLCKWTYMSVFSAKSVYSLTPDVSSLWTRLTWGSVVEWLLSFILICCRAAEGLGIQRLKCHRIPSFHRKTAPLHGVSRHLTDA